MWSPAYLEQVVGLPRTAAVTAAAAFPAAMLLGRSAGSVLVRRVAPAILYPATLCLIVPGFLAFWGGFSAPVAVLGLFLAGLAIALLYPLSLSFAVGAAGAAGNAASARSGLAAGTAVLTAPIALGALADRVGLSQRLSDRADPRRRDPAVLRRRARDGAPASAGLFGNGDARARGRGRSRTIRWPTMIALPIRIGRLGASRQTIHPMIVAQSSIVYWNGASTAVGVIASARVRQTKHSIATMPSRNSRPRSSQVGVTQIHGSVAAPIRPAPANCQTTRCSQCTPRSLRVTVWPSANIVAPSSASGEADDSIALRGLQTR